LVESSLVIGKVFILLHIYTYSLNSLTIINRNIIKIREYSKNSFI